MFTPEPDTLRINDTEIEIDPDFRIMCGLSAALSRHDTQALAELTKRFYKNGVPKGTDSRELTRKMAEFYVRGFIPDDKDTEAGSKKSAPLFDFEKDECYFRAAYLAEYGIDLTTARMHWAMFCGLFRGLPDECRLKQIISIRAADLSKIKNREERRRIEKLQRLYSIGSAAQESEVLTRIRANKAKKGSEDT